MAGKEKLSSKRSFGKTKLPIQRSWEGKNTEKVVISGSLRSGGGKAKKLLGVGRV